MKFIRKLILLILFLLAYNVQAQYIFGLNLVKNPSFEEFYSCPITSGELYKSKYWLGISTEYYNICNIGWGGVSVPSNFNGYQFAKTGVSYAGFLLNFHPKGSTGQYMESIKNILSDSLKKNTRYCINYYISLANFTILRAQAENSIITYDSIGVLFTANQVQDNASPIICDTCSKYIKSVVGIDTLNWMKISGNIIAQGGEKYLTIGKFNTMNWDPNLYYNFYVYVDDVSVCECSFDISLGEDTSLCEGESIILNPDLPNATYTWQDSSHAATYETKQPGTYWVRAYLADYDITSTDTIVITYKDCSNTIPDLRIPDSFTPNGDGLNDKFEYFYTEYYDITTLIYNRWGQLLFQSQNTDFWDGKYKRKTVHPGTYIYYT
jgi:gliding motility-associated-like protein